MHGQVVDSQGRAMGDAAVALQFEGRLMATTKTNSTGGFVFRGLRGGTFQISAASGSAVFRLWAHNTAPPLAATGAVIAADREAAAGQNPTWGPGPRLLMLGVIGGMVTGRMMAASEIPSGG